MKMCPLVAEGGPPASIAQLDRASRPRRNRKRFAQADWVDGSSPSAGFLEEMKMGKRTPKLPMGGAGWREAKRQIKQRERIAEKGKQKRRRK